jgi:hypothetical protein
MRKALTLVLLAATTALTVPAAVAQDVTGDPDRAELRQERQERRQERQERREERRTERPAVEVDAGARVERREERQERRAERRDPMEWQGDLNDPAQRAARDRYERLERQNQLRYGTADQRRELRQERREDRQERRDDRRDWRADRRDDRQDRRDDRRDWRDDRRDDRRDWRDDRRDWRADRRADRRDWNRDWRRDQRYDWRRYRDSNRFVFRIQPYYAPYRGYSYRRFSVGQILDQLFWGRNYWISDPWQYRLPAAPYGYVWVRYYNDVVLVDTYTGEIVDVIHDFFW